MPLDLPALRYDARSIAAGVPWLLLDLAVRGLAVAGYVLLMAGHALLVVVLRILARFLVLPLFLAVAGGLAVTGTFALHDLWHDAGATVAAAAALGGFWLLQAVVDPASFHPPRR